MSKVPNFPTKPEAIYNITKSECPDIEHLNYLIDNVTREEINEVIHSTDTIISVLFKKKFYDQVKELAVKEHINQNSCFEIANIIITQNWDDYENLVDIFKKIVSNPNFDVNQKINSGFLMKSLSTSKKSDLLSIFLEREDADLNIGDSHNMTALLWSVSSGGPKY
eukprot:TRINITY_DN8776_c0_g1_i2.p1 TRINITY_DN8776_c0_g1~~TRINITY_DN8776_c0_g1_i2.p1  ORF type:complete len:166 (+),score=27.39 TRINITY_DN8776_c0_g1_i2:47-544(+)